MTDRNAALESVVARLRLLTSRGWPDDLLNAEQPAFLARRLPDGSDSWYAIAHTGRQAREVREYLLAFVGPSYSDFTGQPARWNRDDPVESELAEAFPLGFKLSVHPADVTTVMGLLTRLRQLLRERLRRSPSEPQPLSRMLSDFELLVRAKDWPSATRLLESLRERGQLTASQWSGLNIRLMAGQEHWAMLIAVPELPGLVAHRLPVLVAEAIAAAVYHEHLSHFEVEADAVAHYREQVAPVYGQIFRQRAAWRHSGAVAAGRIADAATRPVVSTPVLTDSYSAALQAHRQNDSETALLLLLEGPFTPEAVRLLVEVAVDLGTLEATRASVTAIRGCEDDVREKAFARRASKSLWEELQDIAGDEIEVADAPNDWFGWLKRAEASAWPRAVEVAERGAQEWTRPEPGKFAEAFTTLAPAAFPAIRDALAPILEVLLPDGKVDPAFGSVYRELLERVVLDDELTPNASAAIHELAAAVLQSNPVSSSERNDYVDVIEYLRTAWLRLKRPALLDWGLGMLDLGAEHAIHRHADVSRLVQDVIGEFARVPRLVTPGQCALLRTVCDELDLRGAASAVILPKSSTDVAAPDDDLVLRKKLGKQSVVLLTLGDRIAAMFRELMRQRYPDARVEVVQEYAGTKRLRDLAMNADVFVVNTFDSKHAATGFVSQNRPTNSITLYPKAKNAARQMDAIEDWLRSVS